MLIRSPSDYMNNLQFGTSNTIVVIILQAPIINELFALCFSKHFS